MHENQLTWVSIDCLSSRAWGRRASWGVWGRSSLRKRRYMKAEPSYNLKNCNKLFICSDFDENWVMFFMIPKIFWKHLISLLHILKKKKMLFEIFQKMLFFEAHYFFWKNWKSKISSRKIKFKNGRFYEEGWVALHIVNSENPCIFLNCMFFFIPFFFSYVIHNMFH